MREVAEVKAGRKPYKWIAAEIASCDPEIDFSRIWALSVTYYVNDLMMNVLYTTGLQCFTQPPAASALMALSTRKAIDRKQERTDDTMCHFWRWFELGPLHPDSKGSLAVVNRIHEGWTRQFPGTLPARDMIYTAAWIGVAFHRLRLSLRLSGFTEHQKIATHRYWTTFARNLWSEDGYVTDFPQSFSDMLDFVERYERESWGKAESGRQLADALTEQFAEAWFPRAFRWIGRQIILSIQQDRIRDLMQMGDPNPVARWLIRTALAAYLNAREKLLPDPRLSTPEKARRRRKIPLQHREPPMIVSAKAASSSSNGCPYSTGSTSVDG